MAGRQQNKFGALKHGAYAATAILPGEDRAAFDKLQKNLVTEFAPSGAFEKQIVADIARLMWRKQNMATFRIADLARARSATIESEDQFAAFQFPMKIYSEEHGFDHEHTETAADVAKKELGNIYALVEMGSLTTLERQSEELQIEERLDAMIDRCLKRLLFVRGLKSLPNSVK